MGLALLAGGVVGGCGTTLPTSSLGLPTAAELPSLPRIADLPSLPALPNLPAATGHASAAPTEVYAQVARGATSCWFGAGGVLKKTHIFYADADPPSSGGRAEIALLERDPTAPSSRGVKVYRIAFSSEGTGTRIEHTNHKLPEAVVVAVEADVHRFAGGDLACATAGATAPVVEPPPVQQAAPKLRGQRKQTARNG